MRGAGSPKSKTGDGPRWSERGEGDAKGGELPLRSNIQHPTSNIQRPSRGGPRGGLRGGTGILPVSVYPRGRPVLRPKGTSASDLRVIGASQHTPSMSGGRRNENEWRYLRRLLATFMGGSRGSAAEAIMLEFSK